MNKKTSNLFNSLIPKVILIALGLTLAGCEALDIRKESHLERHGESVDESLWSSIEPGQTSRKSVLNQLGAPDRSIIAGDTETLIYEFTELQNKQVRMIFLFRYTNQKSLEHSFSVRLHNDVVEKVWFGKQSSESKSGDL